MATLQAIRLAMRHIRRGPVIHPCFHGSPEWERQSSALEAWKLWPKTRAAFRLYRLAGQPKPRLP